MVSGIGDEQPRGRLVREHLAGEREQAVGRGGLGGQRMRRAIEATFRLEHGRDGGDHLLEPGPMPFARGRADHIAARVDEHLRRPRPHGVRLPDAERRVVGDGMADAEALQRPADVVGAPLVVELGRVDADDDQHVGEPGLQALQIGQHVLAVDAAVGPEIEQHDLAAQLRERDRRRRVEPGDGALEFGRSDGSEFFVHGCGRDASPRRPRQPSPTGGSPRPSRATSRRVRGPQGRRGAGPRGSDWPSSSSPGRRLPGR